MPCFRSSSFRAAPILAVPLVRMCALLFVLSQSAFAAPLAVLSDVAGQVQVVHGKKNMKGKSGTTLDTGDVVRVETGSATIFYASRAPQTLQAGEQMTVGGAPAGASTSPTWKGLYAGLSSGFARRSQTKAFAVRGSKVDTAPCPLVPAALIAETHPTFVWVAPKEAEKLQVQDYEVYLFGPKGKFLWRTITPNTFVVYPTDAPALQPETQYVWQVTPRRRTQSRGETPVLKLDEESKSVGLWFRVAKDEVNAKADGELARVQGETSEMPPATQRVAQAAALRQFGLATAALQTLMPAIFAPASPAQLSQSPATAAYALTWPTFRAAHAEMDEASHVLVNELATETDTESG
jgi:hypothetical protein